MTTTHSPCAACWPGDGVCDLCEVNQLQKQNDSLQSRLARVLLLLRVNDIEAAKEECKG